MISWAVRDLSILFSHQVPTKLLTVVWYSVIDLNFTCNPEPVNYSTPSPGHRNWWRRGPQTGPVESCLGQDIQTLKIMFFFFFSAWLDKLGGYGFGDLGVVSPRICTQLFWRTKLSKDERWMRGKCIGALSLPSSLGGCASWSYFF